MKVMLIAILATASACIGVPNEDPSFEGVLETVVSSERDDARLAVGLDGNGVLCAEAGSRSLGNRVCGGENLSAVAFQTNQGLVLAGYVPAPVTGLRVVIDGEPGQNLELTPVPGGQMLAFGAIISDRPALVGVEVIDDQGGIVSSTFPSIGREEP